MEETKMLFNSEWKRNVQGEQCGFVKSFNAWVTTKFTLGIEETIVYPGSV